jgi:hypothetical protein
MITFHVFLRSLLLLCCCVLPLTSICAQDEKAGDKPARSVVRGRVIFADSEQPLRRATVRLRKEFNREVLKRTVSGKRGEFSFQGVAAGTYYIDVDAPGVVSLSSFSFTDLGYGVDDSSLTLVAVDGDNDVKTEIRAVRGAVISGRISYVDGEPATDAQLVLYRQKGQTPVLFFFDHQLLQTIVAFTASRDCPRGNTLSAQLKTTAAEKLRLMRQAWSRHFIRRRSMQVLPQL